MSNRRVWACLGYSIALASVAVGCVMDAQLESSGKGIVAQGAAGSCDYTWGCSASWMGANDGCDCNADGTLCPDSDCTGAGAGSGSGAGSGNDAAACDYTYGCPASWMGANDGCDCFEDGTLCPDSDCGGVSPPPPPTYDDCYTDNAWNDSCPICGYTDYPGYTAAMVCLPDEQCQPCPQNPWGFSCSGGARGSDWCPSPNAPPPAMATTPTFDVECYQENCADDLCFYVENTCHLNVLTVANAVTEGVAHHVGGVAPLAASFGSALELYGCVWAISSMQTCLECAAQCFR